MLRRMHGTAPAVAETARRDAPTRAVYREVLADLETPLTAYLKVAGHPSFLLESVEQGERVARYSFIGTGERRRVSARGHDVTVTAGGETRDHQRHRGPEVGGHHLRAAELGNALKPFANEGQGTDNTWADAPTSPQSPRQGESAPDTGPSTRLLVVVAASCLLVGVVLAVVVMSLLGR